ncbi:MAG TPA: hypothetical protein VN519_16855 [Bryobacteraceae bacterium]|nr:hypothetical protein [Bryobacteraceae bacterium]
MTGVEKRVRRAGVIVATGLIIELLSLIPIHALAFIAFAAVGIPVIAAGVILFLLAVVSEPTAGDEAVR